MNNIQIWGAETHWCGQISKTATAPVNQCKNHPDVPFIRYSFPAPDGFVAGKAQQRTVEDRIIVSKGLSERHNNKTSLVFLGCEHHRHSSKFISTTHQFHDQIVPF